MADIFNHNPIIPVVTINDHTKAIDMIHALKDGGINIIELTLRTDNALSIIKTIAKKCPDIIIGAGTVLNKQQFTMAVDHGARFIISPGLTPNLIEFATKQYNEIAYIPGAISPTEVMIALEYGLEYLKFFPAEANNGLNNLKNLATVFPQVKFCPTGGINLENVNNYLNLANVVAIGTSTIIIDEYLQNNNYQQITKIAKEFSDKCKLIK